MGESLSPLLLTAVALECGYPASSIRERVYALDDEYDILLYTGIPDAGGTLGGLVEAGSLAREPNSLTVRFRVTDTAQTIPVTYTGLLPDLFKEGKGVVAQGTLGPDGVFRASEVLAKHDENYMPPAAADAVKQAHETMSTKTLVNKPGERK